MPAKLTKGTNLHQVETTPYLPLLTEGFMNTAPKHNSNPIQPVERQRGWVWQCGRKVPVPDAPEIRTAVLPQFKVNG